MTLRSYDFRSPGELIDQVAAAVPLVEDAAYLVLVARPSTEQRIVTIRRLQTPALIDNYHEASDEIYDVMQTFPIPERPARPDHSVVTVLVRPGLCVFGPNEGAWMDASKYSNHLRNAFNGGPILVTEHGWCDFMTDTAGLSPAMAA
ncbi:MAG TPA: hypothetical protein VFG63_06135 [Nocardioidaceae bacterium]|nr:hypothetical protein [Nocardioidaceae bacterium]